MIKGIHILACFTILAQSVTADELTDLESRLELLTKRLEVQAAEARYVAAELNLANAENQIAAARLEAATRQRDAEQIGRALGLPSIEANRATISVVREPQRRCDATDFIRYTCHRSHSCPAFVVNEQLCEIPGGQNEAMVLTVNYSCGSDIRDQTIPFGQTAYITCK